MTKSQAIKSLRELADRLEASGLPDYTQNIYVHLQIHDATAKDAHEFMLVSQQCFHAHYESGIAWKSTGLSSDQPQVTAFLKWGLTH
jgi:hypothetical protein